MEIAHSMWILIGANSAMLLICVVAELFSQRFATYSRLLVTSHPSTARQFDDLFRSNALGELQGDEFTATGYLYIVQFSLLSFALFSNLPAYLYAVFFVGLGLAFLIFIIGMLSYGFNGRIGGSVSGWRWQQEVR